MKIEAIEWYGRKMAALDDEINRLQTTIEGLDVEVEDLKSENETLQIEHDVMFCRIRDANEQYSPEEVSRFIDAEIKAKLAELV